MSLPVLVNTGKHAVVPQIALPVRPDNSTRSQRANAKKTSAELSLEAELKAMGGNPSGSKAKASPYETGADMWDLLESAARNESGR